MVPIDKTIQELADLSAQLNDETDSLNDVIQQIEDRLVDVRVGVSSWLENYTRYEIAGESFVDEEERDGRIYWVLGFTKIGDAWRIAAKRQSFVEADEIIKDRSNPIALVEAPRVVRVEAAPFLEHLITALAKRVSGFLENIQQAKQLV